jgi:adenylate kinase
MLIIGIRGSGKGTQAKLLAEKMGIPHVSTGEICRGTDQSTELGMKVRKYMDKGILVPDDLVTQLLKHRLSQEDCKNGVVLEGYPRNRDQAEIIKEFLSFDKVLSLTISDEEVFNRLAGRVFCTNKKCEAIFNTLTEPKPKRGGICDKCGSPLAPRKDITEEVVKRDIARYHEEADPLVDYYKQEGLLIEING